MRAIVAALLLALVPALQAKQAEAHLSLADALILAEPYANPEVRFLYFNKNAETLLPLGLGHPNHLSTESDLRPPMVIPNSNGQLLRVTLDDYGPTFRESWERLGEQEPFFHIRVKVREVRYKIIDIETPWKGGYWPEDERYYPKGAFNVWTQKKVAIESKQGEPEKTVAPAPWLSQSKRHQQAISKLYAATKSDVPIVDGEWFLYQTSAQQDRSPGYYDFLGVKKIADLEALAGFDAKVAKKAKRGPLLEAVANSRVSRQPRRISAEDALGKKVWRTFDSKLATEKHNALNVLDSDNFEFDASEVFYGLPNGLWGFALFAANGDRQNVAPDFVGPDTTSTSNDGRIHVGISCIRCHYPNSGLNPIDAWARELFKPPLSLRAATPEIERDLRQKYLRDILGPMEDDRRAFERALKEITGMQPKEYAEAWREFWRIYERPVDLARASAELGIPAAAFKRVLIAEAEKHGIITPIVLGSFLQGKSIGVYQWHEAYAQAQELVHLHRKE